MLFYNETVKPKSFSNNITQESYMSDLTAIANLSILLVEPSEVQQKLIIKSLTQCGVTQVETASNQAQTLALLEKYQPDLVISSMYWHCRLFVTKHSFEPAHRKPSVYVDLERTQ